MSGIYSIGPIEKYTNTNNPSKRRTRFKETFWNVCHTGKRRFAILSHIAIFLFMYKKIQRFARFLKANVTDKIKIDGIST